MKSFQLYINTMLFYSTFSAKREYLRAANTINRGKAPRWDLREQGFPATTSCSLRWPWALQL